eukprot:CAMPEP_0197040824 /NCGR_PEP_ID=MMETSP1384-20130603/17465_1 /TAXON_ID=29189 /ORGANISM="Ammonia sp." /LENGTH=944 /DNA_ID=CAMNT_0042471649 /DNA_START=73 /DNA_END=2903 /DNA_ORIENTATION=+
MSTLTTNRTLRLIQYTCFLLVICLFAPSLSAVLGIDFGSDLVKVAAVVPGRSFDIVLDGASKRSHPNLVVFDDDLRQYGTSASSLVTRRPQRSFLQFSRLLGKPHNTSMIKELQSYFIFNPVLADEKRHTVRFESPYYDPSQATVDVDPEEEPSPENAANILNIIASEPSISVEEVATMKLKHIKRMAEKEFDAEVKDCVITVPEFWSYKERQALMDASQMAGLNVLGLINENTAAALQYALSREYQENKTEVVVFYNMGASSTKVSVVKYFQDMLTSKKSSKSKKTNPGKGAFEVLAQEWDETLGATNFDIELANIIIDRAFESLAQRKSIKADFTDKAFQEKLRKDPRFTARIRTAASRAKKILSANAETLVSIEGVYEDEDFKTTITRDELYQRCQGLFERALTPLTKAVETSGYDKADLESIVLVGGGTRIPQIRSILTDFLEKPLKEDLNADEAPAFGAAFRAANLSSTFRVRAVGMDDITTFAVGVRLKDLRPPEDEEKSFKKRGSLFNENNHLFRRRAVTLKHGTDLKVELFYEKSAALPMDTSRDLGYYEISGISKAVDKYMNAEKYNITELPKVTLSFLLDANGVVDLVSATASFTEWVTEEKEVKSSKTSKKKSKDKDSKEENGNDSEDGENGNGDKTDSENGDSSDDAKESEEATDENEADKKVETELVQRKRTHRVDLNAVRNRPEDVQAMEQSDFAHSAKILLELDERDRSVRETADARNELESYIFESRNRVSDETNVEKVTTAEERETFTEQLSAAEDWIWEIEKESASIYKTKIRELKQVGNPIFSRADEITARPTAINAAAKTLSQLYESVELLRTNYSWINATEIDKLENMTKKAETWLNKKVEEQDEKSLLEKPAFMSYEVYYKVEPIVEAAKKLLSRPKPYGWGKKKKSKNATNETSSSADGDATESEEQSGDDADGDASEEYT